MQKNTLFFLVAELKARAEKQVREKHLKRTAHGTCVMYYPQSLQLNWARASCCDQVANNANNACTHKYPRDMVREASNQFVQGKSCRVMYVNRICTVKLHESPPPPMKHELPSYDVTHFYDHFFVFLLFLWNWSPIQGQILFWSGSCPTDSAHALWNQLSSNLWPINNTFLLQCILRFRANSRDLSPFFFGISWTHTFDQ